MSITTIPLDMARRAQQCFEARELQSAESASLDALSAGPGLRLRVELLVLLARIRLAGQRFVEARAAFEEVLALPPERMASMRRVGDLATLEAELEISAGRPDAAASVLLQAIEEHSSKASPGAGELPHSLTNLLGVAYKYAGRFEEARQVYMTLLRRLEARPQSGDPDTVATVLHNLAGLEHAWRHYDRAEEWARRGLALRRATHPEGCKEIDDDEAALAAILDGQGRYREAESIYRAQLVSRAGGGSACPYDLAILYNNLGANLLQQEQLDEAAAQLREALHLKTDILGSRHPDVGITHHNLAVTYHRLEQPADALLHATAADDVLSATLGPQHTNRIAAARFVEKLRASTAL